MFDFLPEKKNSPKKDTQKKDAQKKDAQKKDAQKKDVQKKDAQKKDTQKKDVQKKDAQKKDALKKDAQKKDAQKKDAQKKDVQKKDTQKKTARRKAVQTPENVQMPGNPAFPQLMREDRTDNNLNHDAYIFSGKETATGKMRTGRYIYLFGEEKQDVRAAILRAGYEEPISYTYCLERPSQKQLAYLGRLSGEEAPKNLSAKDAAALSARYRHGDAIPDPDLFAFAEEMHVKTSYYTGNAFLHNMIFEALKGRDKAAFFIFCVYRDRHPECGANMNTCKYRPVFYAFADEKLTDKSFLKDLENTYEGRNLVFFGTRAAGGKKQSGGTKRSAAYRAAKKYLAARGLY